MTEEQYKSLVAEVGKQAADAMKKEAAELENRLNEKFKSVKEGLMERDMFDKFKNEELSELNKKLEQIQETAKAQGTKINELTTQKNEKSYKSLEEVIKDNAAELAKIYKQGHGIIEVSLSDMNAKAAGVQTVGTNVTAMDSPPGSPYLPGIGGETLSIFDIRYNPNFIMNYVDMGRTNQYRLAWINETGGEGDVAETAEGAQKPLLDFDFKVEISEAKKIAGMIKITEEFEDDLPQLATRVRRLLMEKTVRGFDNAVYAAVIAAATGYTLTTLDDAIQDANYWDAVRAMFAQIATNNYLPNFVGLNPVTHAKMEMTKNAENTYLIPPFQRSIEDKLAESNKVAVDYALVGDLTQYKVDIYKDFVMKMGWNNDDFQRNQFSIVCEVRYHRYISDNRKTAIAYAQLPTVAAQILVPAA